MDDFGFYQALAQVADNRNLSGTSKA